MMGFITPDHKAGYFLGGLAARGGAQSIAIMI